MRILLPLRLLFFSSSSSSCSFLLFLQFMAPIHSEDLPEWYQHAQKQQQQGQQGQQQQDHHQAGSPAALKTMSMKIRAGAALVQVQYR
jgi:hypothetical protein